MGITVIGASMVDIKGYPYNTYIPAGRNAGFVEEVHGGVARNVVEDIANLELRPTFLTVLDDDGASESVLSKLVRHRVDTSYIVREKNGLGKWLAVFDNNNDVVAAISQRPDLSALKGVLQQKGEEIVSRSDSIALEIDLEPDLLRQVFALAKTYGKDVYAVVSNMSIAMERRDLIRRTRCLVCNVDEAGLLFSESYAGMEPAQVLEILDRRRRAAQIPSMIVTMGAQGAVYSDEREGTGGCPAAKVHVRDTTGAGDAFFAGVTAALTYGKSMAQACEIGTRLSASVIVTRENVCPRFLPEEFGLELPGKGKE